MKWLQAYFGGIVSGGFSIRFRMKYNSAIFDDTYRVIAVDEGSLTIRGLRSGETLTIVTPDAGSRFSASEYPPGLLIALSDPLTTPVN